MHSYHKTVHTILDLLKENKAWFETFEHEAVKTSEEASKVRSGYNIDQGAKALILKISGNNSDKFVMLVLPGSAKFNKAKVLAFTKGKSIRFASEDEISEITDGIEIGGIPPFGNIFGLEVTVDPKVLKNEKIIFNAGDRCFSIGMLAEDYQKIVKPNVQDITE